MKTTSGYFRWALAFSTLIMCLSVFAVRYASPPKASHLLGVWSGYSNHNDFLRLEFDENNTGHLGFISVVRDAPVAVYRVSRWKLADWTVKLELEPLTPDADSIQFKSVVFDYIEMKCEFGGKGWERKATLFSERDSRELTERAQKAVLEEKRRSK